MNEETITELAGCIITDDYGRVLLLHRDDSDRPQWELPGGKIEAEESPEQAAARKMHEELGVTVHLTQRACINEFEQNARSYKYHCFNAEIISGEVSIQEPHLFNDFDYFELEDMPSLALSENMLALEQKMFTGEVVL